MTLWDSENTSDAFLLKHTGERAVVGVTCCLSIIGSLLIILSFACFKRMRSKSREILLHISIMDLGVALANLIGDAVFFDQYLSRPRSNNTELVRTMEALCRTQAYFAIYSTYGSVLWTVSLAVYLYLLILHHGTNIAVYFVRFAYVFCYGLPILVSLWLVLTHRLGYAPYNSSGWCSLILKDPSTGDVDLYVTILGYDLWIYLAMVLIPLLYCSVRVYVMDQLQVSKRYIPTERFWSALHTVDYKFLLIPVVFIILRLWTCIINILYLYVHLEQNELPYWLNKTLVYLAGIGDSGQGFANAILFIAFTKNVRNSFIRCVQCKKDVSDEDQTPLSVPILQESSQMTPLLYESLETSYVAIHRPGHRRYGSINN